MGTPQRNGIHTFCAKRSHRSRQLRPCFWGRTQGPHLQVPLPHRHCRSKRWPRCPQEERRCRLQSRDVEGQWAATSWGKKLAARKAKTCANDFQRFQGMVAQKKKMEAARAKCA